MSDRRRSVTVGLAALLIGAVAAGSATVASGMAASAGTTTVTGGVAMPDAEAAAAMHGLPWEQRAGAPAEPPPAPVATTTVDARPTTTEPPPAPEPTTTEPTTVEPTRPAPPPPTTTAPPATPGESQADAVVRIVNAERAQAGCRAVTVDQRLVTAAQGHSADMARHDYFSHTSRDGRTFADRIRAAGYPTPRAENIARGQRSASAVMTAWMNSSGHRANILNCSLTTIGVGLDTDGWYWTQNFGS